MPKQKKHTCLWIIAILFVVTVGVAWYVFQFAQEQVETINQTRSDVVQTYGEERLEAAGQVMPYFLGFDSPKRFLVLLQNNTEMRPTGGFIGAYGIIEITSGEVTSWFVQGTEVLDNNAVETAVIPPAPEPIQKYLVQPDWFFRDMNWDPDFPTTAQRVMAAYQEESGKNVVFDGVVAVTPTVFERLMQYIGPVTVDGVTLNAENFTERLEYEVEYGYEQRGDSFENRKRLMGDLLQELIVVFEDRVFELWPKAIDVVFSSLADKHILLYATEPGTQEIILKQDWGGNLVPLEVGQDGVFVVDANLASLKTDHAIERSYTYTITPEDNRLRARLEVQYNHTGSFDWRTSRYRSYTRMYLPAGVEMIDGEGAMVQDRNAQVGEFTISNESDRVVAGAFFAVEPGESHTLALEYWLPGSVVQSTANGVYTLFVQKQAGLLEPSLTLNLDFGTTVSTAYPAENATEWGDTRYVHTQPLQQDQGFTIGIGTE